MHPSSVQLDTSCWQIFSKVYTNLSSLMQPRLLFLQKIFSDIFGIFFFFFVFFVCDTTLWSWRLIHKEHSLFFFLITQKNYSDKTSGLCPHWKTMSKFTRHQAIHNYMNKTILAPTVLLVNFRGTGGPMFGHDLFFSAFLALCLAMFVGSSLFSPLVNWNFFVATPLMHGRHWYY